MLRVTQQQVAYRCLLAGRWYASAENMTLVRALGHHFVLALEPSCTVALSEGARAQGQFQAVHTRSRFPMRSPCGASYGPSRRRYSLPDKLL